MLGSRSKVIPPRHSRRGGAFYVPGAPPTFPGLNRKRHSSHLRADGADDRTEGIPGQNPERNPGTFRSRHGGNRSGRSEQQFHLRLSPPRADSRLFRLPREEIVLSLVPSAGEAHKPRRKSPFPAAASLFAGGFSKTPSESPGRTVADIPGHPDRKTCAPQAKEQKRDERFRADVASAVPLHSSSVAHFFP